MVEGLIVLAFFSLWLLLLKKQTSRKPKNLKGSLQKFKFSTVQGVGSTLGYLSCYQIEVLMSSNKNNPGWSCPGPVEINPQAQRLIICNDTHRGEICKPGCYLEYIFIFSLVFLPFLILSRYFLRKESYRLSGIYPSLCSKRFSTIFIFFVRN